MLTLVFPPYMPLCCIPEIGMPQLTAFIRQRGFRANQYDLNLTFITSFLPEIRRPWLAEAGAFDRLLLPSSFQIEAFSDELARLRHVYREFFLLHFMPSFHREPAGVLGFSILDGSQLYPSAVLAGIVKEEYPETVVTAGGSWVSAAIPLLPDLLERCDSFDCFIPGAGEAALLSLVANTSRQAGLEDIPGIVCRRGGAASERLPAEAVPIGAIPPPDFDGLPLGDYPVPCLPITSRSGCYWGRCTFCRHVGIRQQSEERAPEQVAAQMERLQAMHGIDDFFFADHATSPAMLEALPDTILARGLHLRWSTMVRVEPVYTDKLAVQLARSGCQYLLTGLEAASADLLRRVDKGIRLEDLDRMLDVCSANGIGIVLFILYLPGMPEEMLDQTFEWLWDRHDRIDDFIFNSFALARTSRAFSRPDLFGLELPEGADRSLNVYDIPFHHRSGKSVAEAAQRKVEQFHRRFIEGRPSDGDGRKFWVASGRCPDSD